MKRIVKINEDIIKELVKESVKRIIKEEISNDVDNNIIALISYLHNCQKQLREIHWNTRTNALHSVTDESIGNVLNWEDTLAEAFIGDRDIKLTITDKKPSVDGYTANDFISIMKELSELASTVKENISGNKDYDAIAAVVDEIEETSNKLMYRGNMS